MSLALDRTTGVITVAAGTIGPTTSRDQLSELGFLPDSEIVGTALLRSGVTPQWRGSEQRVGLLLMFRARIFSVSLYRASGAQSWDEWSAQETRAEYDLMRDIAKHFALSLPTKFKASSEDRFPWGTAGVVYDPHNLSYTLTITYE